ncbi:MAG: SGNH/GDSL hydrolase family protein [Planctomycetes bacterium]|nr:SGNH/GDSL hydrolase family protein [Planctomycetota bacterium]
MPASRRLLLPFLASIALLAPAAWTLQAPAAAASPSRTEAIPLLQHVAVIGASLSAGHGLGKGPKGTRLDLAQVIDAGVSAAHGEVFNASSRMTFLDPVASSKKAFGELATRETTLVVALDYLFWFGYGTSWNGEKERLDALEIGLKSLEELKCPILLGDFPDMSSALKAPQPVLPAQAVPDAATLKKLNERLAAWVKEHPNVVLVPVSQLMGALLAGEELRVGTNLWTKGKVGSLLQEDGLHPTLEGTTGLWLFALERLRAAHKELPANAFETKVGTIDERLSPGLQLHVVDEPIPAKRGKTAPAKPVH